MNGQIEIYYSETGTEVHVKLEKDTLWLTQRQMAELFDKDVRTINEHIQTICKTGELDRESTIRKFRIVRQEGKRQVTRNIDHYNLDMIISVGYRVNSKRGTQFRMWATQRLKDYLVKGYAINEKRLEQKEMEVQHLKTGIQIVSRAIEKEAVDKGYEWLLHYAKGLELLDDYDHEKLDYAGKSKVEAVYLSKAEYQALIDQMIVEFDTSVFGVEKDEGFESAIAQISQGFGDEDFYPTLEEKAATLLYLKSCLRLASSMRARVLFNFFEEGADAGKWEGGANASALPTCSSRSSRKYSLIFIFRMELRESFSSTSLKRDFSSVISGKSSAAIWTIFLTLLRLLASSKILCQLIFDLLLKATNPFGMPAMSTITTPSSLSG